MADVLKATLDATDDSTVTVDLGVNLSDLYVQFDYAIPSATFTDCTADAFIAFLLNLIDEFNSPKERLDIELGADWVWERFGIDSTTIDPGAGMTPDAWNTIALHVQVNAGVDYTITYRVNGADFGPVTFTSGGGDVRKLSLGLFSGNQDLVPPGYSVYFDNVLVGTTDWGTSDVFSDDFESGGVAAWDSSSGDVSVVADPFGSVCAIDSFSPPRGAAGLNVVIHGTGLSGATDVDFNGAAASFRVVDDTTIIAIVPAGATSGPITVTAGGSGSCETATDFTVLSCAVNGFYSPQYRWRFVVATLDSEVLTFLDPLATGRNVTFTLGQPAVATGVVPSDSPEINIEHTDGDPFLAMNSRILVGLRRECGETAWVPRFTGILMQPNDEAETDGPDTHYAAYDPWQYLMRRPVLRDDGSLPGPAGWTIRDARADELVTRLLLNTITFDGACFIDAGSSFGGTLAYDGTIEACDVIPKITFRSGLSVGEAWQQIMETGACDILLDPIWDPFERPGYISELNVYQAAGSRRNEAVFAWDLFSRSLGQVSRLDDGVNMGNVVQMFNGQGGNPIAQETDATSIAKYRRYWLQQFTPGQASADTVEFLALATLALAKDGKQTVTITPAPERSPTPFTDYYLGDIVPVWASSRLRRPITAGSVASGEWTAAQRVHAIPIDIADDGVEEVKQLLLAGEDV